MVAMSKLLPAATAPVFTQRDLAGPWRVYLQRVESKLAGSTIQIGQLTFSSTGVFGGGALQDAALLATSLTTGSLLVSANGSVTGSLTAGALASTTADRYTFKGTMRAGKDLITGVITASLDDRTTLHHGLVTLVREVTLFDFGLETFDVVEGSPATITVFRTGNREGTVRVAYAATAGTAPPGDFTAASGTLTFGPNVASRTFSVPTATNTVVEDSRTVSLQLSTPEIVTAPTGVSVMLGTAAATLNINDNDVPGIVTLGAATYNVTEATANATITIKRTGGTASGVVVQLVTSDGTAEADRDYTARNASVTFNAGETTRTLLVPIINTPTVDGSRSFTVAITGATPTGAAIGTPDTATVSIADNDVAGTLQFSLAGYPVNEPTGVTATALITVTRTGGTAGGVLVDFTTANGSGTAGSDYAATSGTLTFDAGNTSKTFTIPIFVDALVEGDETVLLSLGNPQGGAALGARPAAVLTIKDAQRGLQFSASDYTVSEKQATATVTVVRSGPATGTATVRYSTSDGVGDGGAIAGTHYTAASGTLTFGNNATSQKFTVRILPDRVVAGPKTVLLLLSNPAPGDTQLGPQSSATLTITDVDAGGTVKLGALAYSVNESLAAATISVSRTGGTAGGVSVAFTTADDCATPPCPGKAQAGVDYEQTLGTLTFGPGETTKTVLVPLTNDTTVEGNETFLFQLSNPQGGAVLGTPVTATATIVDNDQGGAIQLSTATYTVTEAAGVTGTATVDAAITLTRTGSNLASGASVQFATSNGTAAAGSDYTATVTTVVFGAGESTKTVTVPILADPDAEGNETVNLTLSNAGGGATLGARTTAVLTIVDLTSVVQFSASAYAVNEGATATITVVRGGPVTAQARVQYAMQDGTAVANQDYRPAAGTLTFNPNVTSLTFKVATIKRADDNGPRTVTLGLTPVLGAITLGATQSATLTIEDIDPPGTFEFSAPAYSVVEGAMAQVLITRTGGSGGTVRVSWTAVGGNASVPADYTPTTGTVTFGPGVTSQRVPLTIVNDTLAEDPETVTLELAIVSATVGTALLGDQTTTTLTVLDNDAGGVIGFATAAVTAAENVAGGKINLTVTRTGTALAGGVTVDYAASGDTAAVNLPPGTLTFAAGKTSVLLQVPIVTNAIAEADRTVVVTLANPVSTGGATGANAPTLGTIPIATATIVDDEPRMQFSLASYSVTEGGIATITVVRTGTLPTPATVEFTTANGSAVAGTDYTTSSGTLTFGPNVKTQAFTVATADDPAATGLKTVTLQLTPAAGASLGERSTATLTIQDSDSAGAVQFATAAASVVEGGVVRITVTRTGANLTGGVTVEWSATGGTATDGDDFSPSSGSLSFGPGVASQSFDLTVVGGDGLAEGTETIVLSLDPPVGGATLGTPSATTVLIVDAEQSVALSTASYTQGETVTPAAITVVRLGVPTGEITVRATSVTGTALPDVAEAQPDLDYTAVDTLLTFGPGEIVKTVNVPILTANALTRSGNRALGLALSEVSAGASLGVRDTAALTILDFRPDLVITTVSTPSATLAGKLVSAPTIVRNLGMVPAPPFRVGIFFAQDDTSPGAGALLALRDVPGLAPGASASLPTSITVDDDTPPGDYFVSAIADFQSAVGESDENNNGLASAPSFLRVARNLTKFQSASATLSQTSPPAGLVMGAGLFAASSHGCDAQGVLNLSGSFTITSQQQQSVSGIADLSGTLNDAAVRYVITFDGTADDNDNFTATLTSITVSGAVIATGTGSFTGSLDGRTLSGSVDGQIQTSTGGDCIFSGTLSAVGTTGFLFKFGTQIRAGAFGFGTTPDVMFPVSPAGYVAGFTVLFDPDPAPPSAVRFTGPAGSGLSNTPADLEESEQSDDGRTAQYVSPKRTGNVPGGTWSVVYKGVARTFTVPPLDLASRLVVIYPTVSVDANGALTRVSWEYRNLNGSVIAAPSFVRNVQVEIDTDDFSEIESPLFDRFATAFDLGASPLNYAEVREITFRYTDLAGNLYFIEYDKAFSIRVEARLENVYGPFAPTTGSQERLLSVFVDVPSGSVETGRCFPNPDPPFPVTVANELTSTEPFPSPECIERTGTTQFEDGGPLIDIFSARVNLDARAVPYPLAVGSGFNFSVTTIDEPGSPQSLVARLRNAEANPATDFIFIPNQPGAPEPTGTSLADARLGQNMTVSWTLPSFPIRDQRFSPIVNTSDGRFCSGEQQDLMPGTTSTTFRFPTSCDGQPIVMAQFCIFFTGEAVDGGGRESSAGCWFFQDP